MKAFETPEKAYQMYVDPKPDEVCAIGITDGNSETEMYIPNSYKDMHHYLQHTKQFLELEIDDVTISYNLTYITHVRTLLPEEVGG